MIPRPSISIEAVIALIFQASELECCVDNFESRAMLHRSSTTLLYSHGRHSVIAGIAPWKDATNVQISYAPPDPNEEWKHMHLARAYPHYFSKNLTNQPAMLAIPMHVAGIVLATW